MTEMNKIERIPLHGTPPNQKNVGNTVSSTSFGSKSGNTATQTVGAKVGKVARQAAYYGGMAVLGIVGRGFMRGAVHAGRGAVLRNARLVRAMGA